MSTIAIRAVREDGTVEDIPEEDLYRHTRHRWLYNEARNLSQRYLKFNLQGLIQVAVEEASKRAPNTLAEVLDIPTPRILAWSTQKPIRSEQNIYWKKELQVNR
ncbi:hypothetical protein IFR05_009319 [Cadophora sp. M221]|nr:hypothetical protein IFR05_009319 [Cadophora sp. M221]